MTTRVAPAAPTPDQPSPRGPDIIAALREVDLHLAHEGPSRALEARVFRTEVLQETRGTKRLLWLVPAVVAAIVALLFLRHAPGERGASMPVPTSAPTVSPEAPRQLGEGDNVAPEEQRVRPEAPSPRERPHDTEVDPNEDHAPRESIDQEAPRAPSWTKPRTRSIAPRSMIEEDDGAEATFDAPPSTAPTWQPPRRAPAAQRGAPLGEPIRRGPTRGLDRNGNAPPPPSEPRPETSDTPEVERSSPETSHEDGEGNDPGDEPNGLGCEGLDGPGNYTGYMCESDLAFILTEEISCEDALDNCELNAAANPTLGVVCVWSGAIIFVRKVEADDCTALLSELEGDPPSSP